VRAGPVLVTSPQRRLGRSGWPIWRGDAGQREDEERRRLMAPAGPAAWDLDFRRMKVL